MPNIVNLVAIMNKEVSKNDFKKFLPILINITKWTFSNENVCTKLNK